MSDIRHIPVNTMLNAIQARILIPRTSHLFDALAPSLRSSAKEGYLLQLMRRYESGAEDAMMMLEAP